MKSKLFIVFVIFISFLSSTALSETITVRAPQAENDPRNLYFNKILERVLFHTQEDGVDELVKFHTPTSRERTFQLLLAGEMDVVTEAPKPNWESQLLPVRIPVDKGILSYRLFLVHDDYADSLEQIESLDQLRDFSTASGAQWSVRKTLEENDFNVVVSKNYTSLFAMLNAKRAATFSRGVNEIFPEFEQYKHMMPNAKIDESVALHAPLPNFYFVSPKKPELAARIERGLEIMIDNGEFDQMFNDYYGEMIAKANIKDRKVFYINNSNLSDESLAIVGNPRYWFEP